jgi:hypothetical protein
MPSTTDAAFRQFCSSISPSKIAREKASVSHNYIRQVLTNRNVWDPSFPRIQRDFLIGSAVRWTKISPLDDIDVFTVMDGSGLSYIENGQVVPSFIESSGKLPNSLYDLCDLDGMLNSVKVLNKFKNALKLTYPNSEVRRDGQAVTVYLPSPGFTIDIVPAFYIQPLLVDAPRYCIPMGHNIRYWKITNPDLDKARVHAANKIHNGMASHIIMFIKYWNKYRNRNRLRSYHVEVMCLALLGTDPIQNYAEGIFRVFQGAPDFTSHYCSDPKGLEPPIDEYLSYDVRQRTIERLRDHQDIAYLAYGFALLNDHKQAIDQYRNIFGPVFPQYDTLLYR